MQSGQDSSSSSEQGIDGEPASWAMFAVAQRVKDRFSKWDGVSAYCMVESSGKSGNGGGGCYRASVPAYARSGRLLTFAEVVCQIYMHCQAGKKCKAETVSFWLSVVRGNPGVNQFDVTNFEAHPELLLYKLKQLQSFVAEYKPCSESSSDRDKLTDMHLAMHTHFKNIAKLARKRREEREARKRRAEEAKAEEAKARKRREEELYAVTQAMFCSREEEARKRKREEEELLAAARKEARKELKHKREEEDAMFWSRVRACTP